METAELVPCLYGRSFIAQVNNAFLNTINLPHHCGMEWVAKYERRLVLHLGCAVGWLSVRLS